MKKSDRIRLFVNGIRSWFSANKRVLPWRDLNVKDASHRAYLVLVSEIMLQQTQVSRVIILYKNFIQIFPRIEDLSTASNSDILIAWRGLGYNSRALRLRDAARTIVGQFKGRFPDTYEELLSIKGIGPYTAAAVLNFSFGIPTACVDTNIRRILHRFFIGPETDKVTVAEERVIAKLSEETMVEALEQGFTPADWYAALMDFGSLVSTKNSPKWHLFNGELKNACLSYGKGVKRKKKAESREPGHHMSGAFVPRRILRGRIIEQLRDAKSGLTPRQLCRLVTLDTEFAKDSAWIAPILQSLEKDGMIRGQKGRYSLAR